MKWKTFFQICLLIILAGIALWIVLHLTIPKYKSSINKPGYKFNKVTGEWTKE